MSTHITSETWPPTVDELIEAIEGLFDCQVGLPRYYAVEGREGFESNPYMYRTLAYFGTDSLSVRRALWGDFKKLRAECSGLPTLYWRYDCKIEETSEEWKHKIWTRVAIPGLRHWPVGSFKPEGDPVREVA